MKTQARLWAGVLALAMWVSAPAWGGSIRYVDDDNADGFACDTAPYSTIAEALAASDAGDEIRVCPGVYTDQLVLPFPITIRGELRGVRMPVIRPVTLPGSLTTLDGGNPIVAAVMTDGHLVRLSDLEVDLANVVTMACSPMLAGVYARNATVMMDRVTVRNVRVSGRADCDSGLGMLAESGVTEVVLGDPVYGRARVMARDSKFQDFQKAGVVAVGPKAMMIVKGGESTTTPGVLGGAVAYGYQVSGGARGKLVGTHAAGMSTPNAGKVAAGLLGYESVRLKSRRATFEDSQVGVFSFADQTHIKRAVFRNHSSDAVILLGDGNGLGVPDIDGASVSGCFVQGDRNVVSGGYITNAAVGIWFQDGFGNSFFGVDWGNVPVETCGLYCGLRDMTAAAVTPFTTRCTGPLSCDDGNACTTDLCDEISGTCGHGITVCDDANGCTDDSCVPATGCVFTIDDTNACSDASVCTSGDLCTAGVCSGTPVVCDDTNPCTTDSCDPTLGCQATTLPDGTPCGVSGLCTGGICL